MSATLTAVATAPDPADREPWLNGVEACRLGGLSVTRLQRLGLLGDIEVQLLPGRTPRYRRSDIERLAARITRTTRA